MLSRSAAECRCSCDVTRKAGRPKTQLDGSCRILTCKCKQVSAMEEVSGDMVITKEKKQASKLPFHLCSL